MILVEPTSKRIISEVNNFFVIAKNADRNCVIGIRLHILAYNVLEKLVSDFRGSVTLRFSTQVVNHRFEKYLRMKLLFA